MAKVVKVSLLRYACIPCIGWRRGLAVVGKTGKIKPNVMLVGRDENQKEIDAKDGYFQLRRYVNGRPVYTNVGNEPGEALAALEKARHEASLLAQGFVPINSSDKPKPQSLEDYRVRYLEQHNQSVDARNHHGASVNGFLATVNYTNPAQITQRDIVEWCKQLDEKFSDRTRANRYRTFRSFLRFCGIDPKSVIKDSKIDKRLRYYENRDTEYYEDAEIQRLFAVCKTFYRVLFKLLWLTGLRDEEVQHLRWSDIVPAKDGGGYIIQVREKQYFNSKGRKLFGKLKTVGELNKSSVRDIPVVDSLYDELVQWREKNPGVVLVFGTENDNPNTHMLENLKKYAAKAGLNCGECRTCASGKKVKATGQIHCQHWYLHGFRATFASNLFYHADKGEPFAVTIKRVQELMGHSPNDLKSTMRYIRGNKTAEKRDAMNMANAKQAANVMPFVVKPERVSVFA